MATKLYMGNVEFSEEQTKQIMKIIKFTKDNVLENLDELTLCYCPSYKDVCYSCKKNNCILYRKDKEEQPSITEWYKCSDCVKEYLIEDRVRGLGILK